VYTRKVTLPTERSAVNKGQSKTGEASCEALFSTNHLDSPNFREMESFMSSFKTAMTTLALILTGYAGQGVTQTEGPRIFSGSNASQVVSVQQGSSGFGLKSTTPSTSPVAAIFGKATATSGFTNGLWGQSFSTKGVGVRGQATATSGPATGGAFFSASPQGFGLLGENTAPKPPSGRPVGVHGIATATNGVGVFGDGCGNVNNCSGTGVIGVACGEVNASGCNGVGVAGIITTTQTGCCAVAGLFANAGVGGNILEGANNNAQVFRVDLTGKVYADGGFSTGGADFAEAVAVRGEPNAYSAGDVLVIDQNTNRQLALAHDPYSTLVAGIYSTKPGLVASPHEVAANEPITGSARNEVPLAVVGIVPTRVTAENGAIQRGDLLVTSSKPGYAMKGTDTSRMVGAVLGKALEPLPKGEGVIQILVTLQ
jgi:hypothetical protein